MPRQEETVTIEGARLAFKNFAGKEGQFNREGDRNFAVILDEDVAAAMLTDGWNVRRLKPREDDEGSAEGSPYISVSVSYKGRPPQITLVSSRGRTPISEDEVEVLDWVEFANVDLIINPYNWAVNGKTGVKAYLKKMFITIVEDELDRKYEDVPMALEAPRRMALTAGGDDIIEGEVID